MSEATQDREVDVLVVGAGPVGLTAACELARHGARCRVVDADEGPTPENESRALAVWERTLEVFAGVGVIDGVLAHGKRLRGMNAYARGARIVHLDLGLDDEETPYPFVISLPQWETQRLLLERLRAHGVEVEWRTRLAGFRQDKEGVTATLAGPDGRESSARVPWLVGCDGAHSAVRHGLGLAFEGAPYEEPILLADVKITWDLPEDEAHVLLSDEGGGMAAFPLPAAGRWRLIDATGAVETEEPGRIVERFRALARELGQPGAGIDDPAWTASFRIHRRNVDRLRVGRVFVAGDAAHIHSPVGGQGMNTGIQDAYNLAWKLALAVRGRASEALLDSYHAERHPVAEQVLKGTDLATRMLTLRGDVPRRLRDRVYGLVGEFAFARRRIAHGLSELGIAYPQSPAVGEDRGGLLHAVLPHAEGPGLRDHLAFAAGPKPGDRAPDVVLGQGGPPRLFDLLSEPRQTLLLFPGGSDSRAEPAALGAVGDLVADRYARLIRPWLVVPDGLDPGVPSWRGEILRDPGGALGRRYGAASACLYLIRPDGYIGYRAQPPQAERLGAYLDRLFPG